MTYHAEHFAVEDLEGHGFKSSFHSPKTCSCVSVLGYREKNRASAFSYALSTHLTVVINDLLQTVQFYPGI